MRRLSTLFSVLAASLLLSAGPTVAGDMMGHGEMKDECLLVSRDCTNSVDSITQRIEKLEKEISKGTAVYTSDELTILNRKLHEETGLLNTVLLGS